MMSRISPSVDTELDTAFPESRGARVTIETEARDTYALMQPHRKGDPEPPLSDADPEDKLRELSAPVIGERQVSQLIADIWSLESQDDIQGF